jgi:hypothetical protein
MFCFPYVDKKWDVDMLNGKTADLTDFQFSPLVRRLGVNHGCIVKPFLYSDGYHRNLGINCP